MARTTKLIEPIKNATMKDVARAILKKKKDKDCEDKQSKSKKKSTQKDEA